MTLERSNHLRYFANDIWIYNPDTLALIDAYFHRTGLYLPLYDLLKQWRMDGVRQSSTRHVDSIAGIRQDLGVYLRWRADHIDRLPVRDLDRTLPASEEITGILVTVYLMAKNDYFVDAAYVLSKIDTVMEHLNNAAVVASPAKLIPFITLLKELKPAFREANKAGVLRILGMIHSTGSNPDGVLLW